MDHRKSTETIKKSISSPLLPEMLRVSWQLHHEIATRLEHIFPDVESKKGKNISEIDIENWRKEHSMHASASGTMWQFAVDIEGNILPFQQWENVASLKELYAIHHIAVSFRGPVLFHGRQLALRDILPGTIAMVDVPDSKKFRKLAEELAMHHSLVVMDSLDANKWTIPESDLTSEMKFRLDFTDQPSVFQLLIQETIG